MLVYTEDERARLSRVGVFATGNGLYSRTADDEVNAPQYPGRVVFSGRLVEDKEPLLLLDALRQLVGNCDTAHLLTGVDIIGYGPLESTLRSRASSELPGVDVVFHGELWEYDRISSIYARAAVSVSPGYVGLSAVQSLWFGRPLVWRARTSRPHAPELAALNERNSIRVSDQPGDSPALALAKGIAAGLRDNPNLSAAHEIAVEARSHYAAENMVGAFVSAINFAPGPKTRELPTRRGPTMSSRFGPLRRITLKTSRHLSSFGQEAEDRLVLRHLSTTAPGLYLEFGAFHPVLHSNTLALYLAGWAGICVDPNPRAESLWHIFRRRDHFLRVAVGEPAPAVDYYEFERGEYNTIDRETADDRLARGITLRRTTPTRVVHPMETLEPLEGATSMIRLISIDIEGIDDLIIEMLDWSILRPELVIVESLPSADLAATMKRKEVAMMEARGYAPISKLYNSLIFGRS